MPPRRRKPENEGLPKYLYRHAKKPGYRLWNPLAGEFTYLPDAKYTKRQAVGEAESMLAQVKSGRADTLAVVIPKYLKYLKKGNNKPGTLAVKRSILMWYARHLGKFRVSAITRTVLQEHWETIGNHGWQKHRSIWRSFLQWCDVHNYVSGNEAEHTLPPPKLERATERHTGAGIAKIRAKSDPWLQVAIDVAVFSLQDRSTLCKAKRSDVTKTDKGLRWDVVRPKTDAALTIHAPRGSKLHNALDAALNLPVTGSYLIRRSPKRRVKITPDSELTEWSQILPDFLGKAFAAARKASDAYPDFTAEQMPGFHQLRAWGSHLYRQAGYPIEYVQALMAHESKEMTADYQDGHGVIERETVEAGL